MKGQCHEFLHRRFRDDCAEWNHRQFYVIDPAHLYEVLWAITDFCLTPDDRQSLLNESEGAARVGYDMCTRQAACPTPDELALQRGGEVTAVPREEDLRTWRPCLAEASCRDVESSRKEDCIQGIRDQGATP